jgi:RNA polymerase sigma factor (sigma-70 family)
VAGRSPLLRLQSDERLIALVRRGNHGAFEALVSRYTTRLLAFCRHMLGSREDAEDVLQEVFAAAYNAIAADERPINVRPWLYRIARNRSLNHLRRTQAIGVDSMDVHFAEQGMTTADQVHRREEFRLLVGDVQQLPETQRSALVLREMDNLSYEQIAEAMDTTVPSVKSLLVRARIGLAEAAEARALTCDEVRLELGEVAEGLTKMSPAVRRHLKGCDRCSAFRHQLRETNKALAAVLPIGPLLILKKLILAHLGHSAGGGAAGGTATATGGATGGAVAGGAAAGSTGGLMGAGLGTIATKAAAGLAAAALVSAGAVEIHEATTSPSRPRTTVARGTPAATPRALVPSAIRHRATTTVGARSRPTRSRAAVRSARPAVARPVKPATSVKPAVVAASTPPTTKSKTGTGTHSAPPPSGSATPAEPSAPPTQSVQDTTTLAPPADEQSSSSSGAGGGDGSSGSTSPPAPPSDGSGSSGGAGTSGSGLTGPPPPPPGPAPAPAPAP